MNYLIGMAFGAIVVMAVAELWYRREKGKFNKK